MGGDQAPGDSRHAAVSVASQNVLRKYGYNGEPAHLGAVQPEVRAALHQHARLEKKLRRSVWALVAMGVALLLTLACVFGVSVAEVFQRFRITSRRPLTL